MLLALDFEQNAFCCLNTNKTGVNFDSRFSVVSLLLSGTICYAFLSVFIEIYFKEDCETLIKMYTSVSNRVKAGKEEGSEKVFLMAVSLKMGTIVEVRKVARGIQMGDT